jgi:hypothetical protein
MDALTKPYEPALIYFRDGDAAEYVERDVAVVYEEIGSGAAIVRDMETREILGFRIQNPRGWAADVTAK